MPYEYKTFCIADLNAMIRETALEIMLVPALYDEEIDTLKNTLIATYNDGIRTFADTLVERLSKTSEE